MNACPPDFPAPAVDRKFWRILLLSALVHGSLFALISWERQQGLRQLPPLLASIRLALPETVAAPAVANDLGTPRPAASTPPRTRRVETPVRPLPAPADAPAMPGTSADPARNSPMAAAEVLPATANAAPPAAQSLPQSAPPVAAVDSAAEALARYRQRLTTLLARQQVYPRIAEMRGWEGEVRLRLRVARKGQLLAVALDRSSGHAVLDEHAAAMLAELGSLPPLPETVEGSEIQVVVPVNYRLNRAT